MRSTISRSETTISGVHSRPSSSGMNSINRTITSSRRANSANPSTWSSLNPRSSTQLIFSGVSPAALARAHSAQHRLETSRNPRNALECRLVHGVHAHRTRSRPASLSGPASPSSRCPLVVSAKVQPPRRRGCACAPARGSGPAARAAAAVRRPSAAPW